MGSVSAELSDLQSEGSIQKPSSFEYEHVPVPLNSRKSLLSVTWVWVGFPMIITAAVTGATLVNGMGFSSAVWAMVIGNLLLFVYVGLLSALGAKLGMNFALLSSRTFGTRGYIVTSGLLSTIVIGWFAVQTGLTGSSMVGVFHVSSRLIILIAGLLYLCVTLLGIRALAIIGMISAPLFLLLGLFSTSAVHSGAPISNVHVTAPHTLAMGTAITLVFALFADSGTMTADFTRWAKNRRHATLATFMAFPVANLFAMLVGASLAAYTKYGTGDIFDYIAGRGGWLAVLAIIFLFLNLGCVCTHCLYNGSVGWSHIVGGKMRVLTIILGSIGIVAAVLGIWNVFTNWLNFLGVLVPPIGTILILDQYVIRPNVHELVNGFRLKPFVAWALGSAVAMVVNFKYPTLSTALMGIVISGLGYIMLCLPEWRSQRKPTTV